MSQNFIRKSAVQIGEIYTNDLDIEFDVDCTSSDDASSVTATVKVYNLSKTTASKIASGALVKIWAGYADDYGIIYLGRVSESRTSRDGADTVTEISCIDYSWPRNMQSRTYAKGEPISNILRQLFADAAIPAGENINDAGATLSDTYTTQTDGKATLDDLLALINGDPDVVAKNIPVHYALISGNANIIAETQTTSDAHVLSSSTGLIETSTSTSDEYDRTAKILLNWRIAKDSLVYLESFEKSGYYRVSGYKHSSSGDTYETQLNLKSMESV